MAAMEEMGVEVKAKMRMMTGAILLILAMGVEAQVVMTLGLQEEARGSVMGIISIISLLLNLVSLWQGYLQFLWIPILGWKFRNPSIVLLPYEA